MLSWEKTQIKLDDGSSSDAVMPVIISASRSTDIPAFYSEWLINRIKKGYITWINPFNRVEQQVSFDKCKLIVFWSKNPEPIISYLFELDQRNINYYFQFTLNDYEKEGLEPNIPPLDDRIKTFKVLSDLIGKQRVIWRFDPIILSDQISIDHILSKIFSIGNKLKEYTEHLTISFADIKAYKKVQLNLNRKSINYHEITDNEMIQIGRSLNELNRELGLNISTCAENVDLKQFGIKSGRCIDDELIVKLFRNDPDLMKFIGLIPENQMDLFQPVSYKTNLKLKDSGQRKACGCILSKDIGMYNTCDHLCVYCYANHSEKTVKETLMFHDTKYPSIVPLNK